MDVEKICRTCLSLSGPFLSIYDGGSGSCLVDMLCEFTRIKPRIEDNLPTKVCLSCISEISHCHSFKLKCENSHRTLRQLVPNALPEDPEIAGTARPAVETTEKFVQTVAVTTATSEVQTDNIYKADVEQNTSIEKPVPEVEEAEEIEEYDYEYTEEPDTDETPFKASAEHIILHVEKDNIKYETEMVYDKNTGELHEQTVETHNSQSGFKYRLVSNGNDTYIASETPAVQSSQITTRKSSARLLQQQQQQLQQAEVPASEEQLSQSTAKRSTRRRRTIAKFEEKHETLVSPAKQPQKSLTNNSINISGPLSNEVEEPTTNYNYHCERCNAGFALEKSLIIHRRQNGCTNRNFKCNECERVFVSLEHLTEHQATHNEHNCQECSQRFGSKEELGRHMVHTHKRNQRNQCNLCQKVFTMLSTLRDHMRIHTGEKPFVCNVCGKGFTQNANLRQHKLRHSDIKRFKCELCSNSFVTKAELTSHARTHTGVKPYECDVCNSKFTTSCSLAKHKRKHTGERPYACDLCPMRFTALNVLKNHRRTHTGERPFVCPFCSKSFTQRGDCQMHQRTHQSDKVYICPVCSEEFKIMSEMRNHLQQHAQEDKRLVHFTLISNKENGNTRLEDTDDESNTAALFD